MFHVVELPLGAEAHAWFAFDEEDLLNKVAAGDPRAAHEIWDSATPRELLDLFDETPESAGVQSRYPGICALGAEAGWDTPLYRADYLQEPGLYGAAKVSPIEACRAALRARAWQSRFYDSDEMALVAVDQPDPLYDAKGGAMARWALRQQLIAVEVLADDQ